MFVLCPHCQFLVAVDPVNGLPPPRCPRCNVALTAAPTPDAGVPAAAAAVQQDAPAHASTGAARHDASSSLVPPPAGVDASAETAPEPVVHAEPPPAVLPPPEEESGEPAPRATQRDAAPARSRKRVSGAWIVAALSVLLAVQLLLADRAQLAADAQWRPTLSLLCNVLRCTLPPWREPEALTLLERDVTADPRHPGVLRVTGRFRNDARWPQPWPELLLTLSDADGRVAGQRMFTPSDYHANAITKNELASGQIATIGMDVIEPAPRIVAFTFEFR